MFNWLMLLMVPKLGVDFSNGHSFGFRYNKICERKEQDEQNQERDEGIRMDRVLRRKKMKQPNISYSRSMKQGRRLFPFTSSVGQCCTKVHSTLGQTQHPNAQLDQQQYNHTQTKSPPSIISCFKLAIAKSFRAIHKFLHNIIFKEKGEFERIWQQYLTPSCSLHSNLFKLKI